MKNNIFLTATLFLAFLTSGIYRAGAQCTPVGDQDVIIFSTGNYLWWQPSSSVSNTTYDIYYNCGTNGTCLETHINVAPNAVIHSTYGYIGIALPVGVLPEQASIFPLQNPPCPKDYGMPLDPIAGDLATDNIDGVWSPEDVVSPSDTVIINSQQRVNNLTYMAESNDAIANSCHTGIGSVQTFDWGVVNPSSWTAGSTKTKIKVKYYNNPPYIGFYVIGSPTSYNIKVNSVDKYTIYFHCVGEPAGTDAKAITLEAHFKNDFSPFLREENELFINADLKVAPNPASESFQLQNISFTEDEPARIAVFNEFGQLVKSWNNLSVNQLLSFQFNVEDLPRGFYLLEIQSGENMSRVKFIKSE